MCDCVWFLQIRSQLQIEQPLVHLQVQAAYLVSLLFQLLPCLPTVATFLTPNPTLTTCLFTFYYIIMKDKSANGTSVKKGN